MKRFVVIVLFCLFWGGRVSADEIAHQGPLASFKVLATIDEDSLKSDFFKFDGRFYVMTRVTNDGSEDETIIVWTQYGWSWLSNNPDIEPGIEALKNYQREVILKPGQSYESKIEMNSSAKKRPVNFRLGFMARVDLPLSTRQYPLRCGRIFWSNGLTLP